MVKSKIYYLAKKVGSVLREKKLLLAVAESCTGGLLAATITAVPGSSTYFERGFVTYSNRSKEESLGVKSSSLKKFGAISERVAKEMAQGVLKHSGASIGVAITGVAGPTGGSKNKPLGTVYLALVSQGVSPQVFTLHLHGDRESVRRQTVELALKKIVETL